MAKNDVYDLEMPWHDVPEVGYARHLVLAVEGSKRGEHVLRLRQMDDRPPTPEMDLFYLHWNALMRLLRAPLLIPSEWHNPDLADGDPWAKLEGGDDGPTHHDDAD